MLRSLWPECPPFRGLATLLSQVCLCWSCNPPKKQSSAAHFWGQGSEPLFQRWWSCDRGFSGYLLVLTDFAEDAQRRSSFGGSRAAGLTLSGLSHLWICTWLKYIEMGPSYINFWEEMWFVIIFHIFPIQISISRASDMFGKAIGFRACDERSAWHCLKPRSGRGPVGGSKSQMVAHDCRQWWRRVVQRSLNIQCLWNSLKAGPCHRWRTGAGVIWYQLDRGIL